MSVILNNVSFSYGEKQVLEGFSLQAQAGRPVCLFGDSGCGKTTVLKLILGIEKAEEGEITAPERISAVFQEDRLFAGLNVLESIAVVGDKNGAEELLGQAGMLSLAKKHLGELSGGMRRRVAILRALNFPADALVLDEPFNALDGGNKEIMAKMILKRFGDKPIIMVSHNPQDAELLGAEIIKTV